jgi:hypothetical protein
VQNEPRQRAAAFCVGRQFLTVLETEKRTIEIERVLMACMQAAAPLLLPTFVGGTMPMNAQEPDCRPCTLKSAGSG